MILEKGPHLREILLLTLVLMGSRLALNALMLMDFEKKIPLPWKKKESPDYAE